MHTATVTADPLESLSIIWCLHCSILVQWYVQVENGTQSEVAALYNMTSNTYTPFHITELPEAAGHLLLPDGRGLIIGGLPACLLSICLSG